VQISSGVASRAASATQRHQTALHPARALRLPELRLCPSVCLPGALEGRDARRDLRAARRLHYRKIDAPGQAVGGTACSACFSNTPGVQSALPGTPRIQPWKLLRLQAKVAGAGDSPASVNPRRLR